MNKRQAKKVVSDHKTGRRRRWADIVQAYRKLKEALPEVREKLEEVASEVGEAVEAVEKAGQEIQEAVDLSKMKVAELRELAKEIGIPTDGLTKDEIRKALAARLP